MPQMDYAIASLQTVFLVYFWMGYLLFVMSILPFLSIELKVKQKIILTNVRWFKNNIQKVLFFRLSHGKLLVKTRGMLLSASSLLTKKKIFFGIYDAGLYLSKHKV